MARAKRLWFADFETTQEDMEGVSIYLWCMVSNGKVLHGTDIKSFVDTIIKKNIIVYFHNLKFDFSYVEPYLLEHNISYEKLDKAGTIYQVKIGNASLRDTMNLWPMSLEQVGKSYCSKYQKTSIETLLVSRGHKYTQEEFEYCVNDCMVVEEAFNNYMDTMEQVLEDAGAFKAADTCRNKLTNAGIAFSAFRELSLFDELCLKHRTTHNEYQLFKEAYKGGYVYSNNSLGLVKGVKMGDINSLYPYVYRNKPLPYGPHSVVTNEAQLKSYKFYVIEVLVDYNLKEGMIPIIGGGVGKFGNAIYKASSDNTPERHIFTSVDWELIKDFYELEYQFIRAYCWETKEGFFEEYVDIFNAVKVQYKDERRNVAKVLLNSPYGKTAMNGANDITKSYLNEQGIVCSEVVGYETDDDGFKYLPMGMAITAYARNELLREAMKIGFDKVVYMDTDSIKFIDDPNNPYDTSDWDPDRLGAWKDEGYADYFKTIAPKKYVYYEKCKISYTCAGFSKKTLSEHMKHNQKVDSITALHYINKFNSGLELPDNQSRVVKGGRSIKEVMKQMK